MGKRWSYAYKKNLFTIKTLDFERPSAETRYVKDLETAKQIAKLYEK
jgi:hypothetical protein